MTDAHGPRHNHLIDAFSETEYERLFPHLELVPMPLGDVIYESGDKLRYTLQRAGYIDYHRGHIMVLDRPGLEARVCECYQVVKAKSDRLLPTPPVITH